MKWFSFAFAFFAGALITVQAGSNTALKKFLGSAMPALIVNYFVGTTAVVIYAFAAKVSVPGLDRASAAPWWSWLGGLLGVAYGLAAVVLGSRLGAATLMAAVVTGQLVCSVLLDHFGWVGFEPHPASLWRIAGCALMITGLVLIARF